MFVMISIRGMNISNVNLNLLVSFDALMAERNVTRAASRTGVTQSAMSNALAQLRRLTGDPLFVRGRRGVSPTDRALALAPPIRHALATIDSALASSGVFDPEASDRTFSIAASDYVEYVVLGPLLRLLEREAPRIRIEMRAWGRHEVTRDLEEGNVDLMLGFYDDVPPGHHAQRLFDEQYVCVVRRDHPTVGARLTLKRYVELSHVLVSQRAGSPGSVDRALAKRGLERKVGARVSHFLMVPALVAQTDMVAALSRRIAEPFARMLRLRVLPPPIALPTSTIGQVWHARTDADAAHTWFRDAVRRVSARV
jgi:DNA-binding transcriptional LysR family regulator